MNTRGLPGMFGADVPGAAFDLERPQHSREGDLLRVGDVLVVEGQHAVLVHADVDRVGIRATQRQVRSMPETSPAKAGLLAWIGLMVSAMATFLL